MHAQRMHALIIDLGGVGECELRNFWLRTQVPAEYIRSIPMPTYIVMSGSGLHLYYVFETPIDLYPNIKFQLKALKYDLTFRFWDYKGTSQVKAIQYQSINQGFRMVDSMNQKYDTPVRVFCTGEKVTIDLLNAYAKLENRVDLEKPFQPSLEFV